MVQSTLTNTEKVQRNKRDHDTMSLLSSSESDDDRGDKEDRYEHDEEVSLYAGSTGDVTEDAASEGADDDTTAGKKKKPVAKPRKKRSETSRLESPWG
jgi:hypothetical protein